MPQKKRQGPKRMYFRPFFQRRACRPTNLGARARTARPKRRDSPFRVIDRCRAVVSGLGGDETVGQETVCNLSLSSSLSIFR
jgi:hypothetical protein